MATHRFVDASEVRHLADDLAAAPARVGDKSARAVASKAHDTERDAKALAPVETGELRDSIHVRASGLSAEVIAGTDHAEYVEDGTSVMAPQPFMRPAFDRNREGLVQALEQIVGDFL